MDAVVTDPPYGIASTTKHQKHGNKPSTDFNLIWDQVADHTWVEFALAAMVPGGALFAFCDTKDVGNLWAELLKHGGKPLQVLYWVKSNPPPQPRKNFCSSVEAIVFARKAGKVHCWNGGGYTQSYIKAPLVGGKAKNGHPTQKPLLLMQKLVDLVTEPGMVVVDPFCGSGTTGEAALRAGCHFIGIDNDIYSVNLAQTRLAAVAEELAKDASGQGALFQQESDAISA